MTHNANANKPSAAEVHRTAVRLRAELEGSGILLVHDVLLPSATRCIAGEPIRGSWWGHPLGSLIYEALARVEPDVARVKLVNAKSTLVHRRLWPALAAVARSREPWQISGLGPECAELLERVEAEGSVRVESLESYSRPERTRLVKELESRLLVYAKSEHTAQGRHEKVLTSFALWQAEAGLSDSELPTGAEAREALATSVRAWGVGSTAGMLPWLPAEPRTRPRRGRSTRQ